MTVTIIAALGRNLCIGRNNQLPWRIPGDLRRFRQLTLGHPVIMGRKTYESIGKPLPGRENIVLTRSPDWSSPGCLAARSLQEALDAAGNADEVFVIGGADIYAQALPAADRLHFTEIDADFDGDAYFPQMEPAEWREVRRESDAADGPGGLRYQFVTYERVHPARRRDYAQPA